MDDEASGPFGRRSADFRVLVVLAHRIEERQFAGVFVHAAPHSGTDRITQTLGFRVLGLRLQAGLDQDSLGLIGVRNGPRYGMPLLQVPRARAIIRPPPGSLEHSRRQRPDAPLLGGPGFFGVVDRLDPPVDLVRLEQHAWLGKKRVLYPLAGSKAAADTARQTD